MAAKFPDDFTRDEGMVPWQLVLKNNGEIVLSVIISPFCVNDVPVYDLFDVVEDKIFEGVTAGTIQYYMCSRNILSDRELKLQNAREPIPSFCYEH